ncbi:hypothetical protein STEG23_007384 [Scotinomys teguina]
MKTRCRCYRRSPVPHHNNLGKNLSVIPTWIYLQLGKEVQGQGVRSDNDLLTGGVLRWHKAPHNESISIECGSE